MLRPELRPQFKAAVKKLDFADGDALVSKAEECAYIFEAEGKPKMGDSRIGGQPDLPAGVDWPDGLDEKGKPAGAARFLAQLNFAQIPPLDDMELPREGMLWLFGGSWGGPRMQISSLHDPKPVKLKKRPEPAKSEYIKHAMQATDVTPLRFERGISLPIYSPTGTSDMDDESNRLIRLASQFVPKNTEGQIAGHYIQSEHNLLRYVAFERLGKPDHAFDDLWATLAEFDEYANRKPPFLTEKSKVDGFKKQMLARRPRVEWIMKHRDQVNEEAARWRLLVQFRSGNLEMGDGLSLDIFIRQSDLEASKFDDLTALCLMVL